MIQLICEDPSAAWPPLELSGRRPLVVGRGTEADLRVPDDTVSRRHAQLEPGPDGVWSVTDLDSRNGTWLDGVMVRQALLRPGHAVTFGRVRFRVATTGSNGQGGEPNTSPIGVVDDALGVRTWSEIGPVRLDGAHLDTLVGAWTRLAELGADADRIQALVEMVTERPFPAWHACVVRLDEDPGGPDAAVLVARVSPSVHPPIGFTPYLSRRVLEAAGRTLDAVCGTNAPGDASTPAEVYSITVTELSKTPRDVICVPWCGTDGAVFGLYLSLPPGQSRPEWIAFYRLAVRQMLEAGRSHALAIRAAELDRLQHDLERAAAIQAASQGRDQCVGRLEVAVNVQPSSMIGGDITLAEVLPDGRLAVMLADVSGHGLDAALMASAVHAMVRSSLMSGSDVATAARVVNETFLTEQYAGRFVTMILAAIDPATLSIEVVNAGHPPVFCAAQASCEPWPAGEHFPLGVTEQPIDSHRAALHPGSAICLYSDGLTELRHADGAELGIGRLLDLCSQAWQTGGTSAAALSQGIIERVDRLRLDARRLDDESLLVVSCGEK